ncbi:MAG: response regulator transcription factor [Chitinophagaceae bacterium]
MNNKPIRILLADDHKLVRESWKTLLENNPRFQVVADCDNGNDAIEKAGELLPDIALVDINMSPLNGFSVTEAVAARFPSVKVIGLSANNQPKYAHKMLELGASGYLTKTSSLEEILYGIGEVYKGNIYICEEIKKYLSPD